MATMIRRPLFSLGMLTLCGVCAGVLAPPAHAQTEGPPPGEVATEPIRCWWRTDRPAVHVGERFTVALTCRVIETASVTVVPAVTQLDPAAVLLTPFEATGGVRHDDILAPPWRYLQYEYTVRFVGEGMFGQDVALPPLTVTYNVQAASGGGIQGRDQGYVLPALPVRIVSLTPGTAGDIRDASSDTFAGLEAQRFRATASLVASGVFFALAAVLVGLAGVRVAGRGHRGAPIRRSLPVRPMLAGCLQALGGVKAEAARDGWSPALARRAAAALRVAGATATGRAVAQTPCDAEATAMEGQLLIRRGRLRATRTLISAPTTADALHRSMERARGGSALAERAAIQPLRDALQTFNTAAYGQTATMDTAALDRALDEGSTVIRRLRATSVWPRWARRSWSPRPVETLLDRARREEPNASL